MKLTTELAAGPWDIRSSGDRWSLRKAVLVVLAMSAAFWSVVAVLVAWAT